MLRDPAFHYRREADFQRGVIELARLCGWQVHYTTDSRRSTPGFPDLVLWHPVHRRLMFRELKTQRGALNPSQKEVLQSLAEAGADVGVWRPADWDAIEEALTHGQG